MRINHEPKRYEPTEDEKKEMLLDELRKESLSIISLAVMYAKGYKDTGEDVTKIYKTAEEQRAKFQEIYNKGFEDGYEHRQIFTVNVIVGGKDV